jgi:hypothetical protein
MRHFATFLMLSLAAVPPTGCGSNDDPTDIPTQPTPVAITETFSGTLTVNGLKAHSYTVDRAGTMSAQLKTISDSTAAVALSLGTWNGVACQIIIANPAAVLNTTVTGTAQSTGQFCVLLQDAGRLTAAVDYTIDVTHF